MASRTAALYLHHTVPSKFGSPRMIEPPRSTVTRVLAELRDGDRSNVGELFELIYPELRALAARQRNRWEGDFTLNTTALVHEAYLKLMDQNALPVDSRAHFFAVAATAMRHILCNHARDRNRLKRGGDLRKVPLDEAVDRVIEVSDEQAEIISLLDESLRRLEAISTRQSEIVECRFFGGLTIEDTAMALGTSPATVKREWALARAWLFREMHPHMLTDIGI